MIEPAGAGLDILPDVTETYTRTLIIRGMLKKVDEGVWADEKGNVYEESSIASRIRILATAFTDAGG